MWKSIDGRFWLGAMLLLAAAGATIHYLASELRGYSLLAHFVDPGASRVLLNFESTPVTTQEVILPAGGGSAAGRLYLPSGVAHPAGMVVVHGIHHLGIDEPRLKSFAHAAASIGFTVLTPEVSALADYRVDTASVDTIGLSAQWLSQRLRQPQVTVVAVSFAGGLALLAACDPRYAANMKSLLLMGAYDDLQRVVRFLATGQAELPDGQWIPYKAHDYGAAVFVYSHLDQFFAPGDRGVAHQALRDWLWEQPQPAQTLLPQLSSPGRELMQLLLTRDIERLQPQLLAAIAADESQLAALSPAGKLACLRTPTFVLHGATDDIIPSTESLWLEREIPRKYLRRVLITPAFSHVNPEKKSTWMDELRLVNFLGEVMRSAN
jgi:pimeloyl-ACP methyl ester carboxylesterase